MGALTVQVEGLSDLEDALDQLPEEMGEKALLKALYAGAGVIRKQIRAKAPVGHRAHYLGSKRKGKLVEPGNLRDFGARIRKMKGVTRGAALEIMPSRRAFYIYFINFGTSRIPANPYVANAFEDKKEEALARIKEVLAKQIDLAQAKLAR